MPQTSADLKNGWAYWLALLPSRLTDFFGQNCSFAFTGASPVLWELPGGADPHQPPPEFLVHKLVYTTIITHIIIHTIECKIYWAVCAELHNCSARFCLSSMADADKWSVKIQPRLQLRYKYGTEMDSWGSPVSNEVWYGYCRRRTVPLQFCTAQRYGTSTVVYSYRDNGGGNIFSSSTVRPLPIRWRTFSCMK